MAIHQLLVFTRPVAGREPEYHRWYDDVHLAEVLGVAGFVAARRYATDDPTRFVAVYTVDSDDVDATMRLFDERRAHFRPTPALDGSTVEFQLLRSLD